MDHLNGRRGGGVFAAALFRFFIPPSCRWLGHIWKGIIISSSSLNGKYDFEKHTCSDWIKILKILIVRMTKWQAVSKFLLRIGQMPRGRPGVTIPLGWHRFLLAGNLLKGIETLIHNFLRRCDSKSYRHHSHLYGVRELDLVLLGRLCFGTGCGCLAVRRRWIGRIGKYRSSWLLGQQSLLVILAGDVR